jgi:D-3-phosphoglycerate dehydrogenase
VARPAPAVRTAIERRVLITTVPFGQQRRPLELLEADAIEYVINPLGRRLKEEELAGMVGDFGVLIAGTEPITARVMDAARRLKLISRVGIGLDSVDLPAARARGITVSYTPEAPSPAVAELAIGLMLGLVRDIPGTDRVMRDGVWRRTMGRRLSSLTVGVIGVGRIGKRVIRHLSGGFPGVRILANDINPDHGFGSRYGVEWREKDSIYRVADLITLHLPLTPQTRTLIGAREIGLMKPTAAVVNTSRGNMIHEQDLASALRDGRLAGAAIDVFEREPYAGELATIDRCILTCHMGSMSEDCRARMELEATEEALRFLKGEPLLNLVPESEYATTS